MQEQRQDVTLAEVAAERERVRGELETARAEYEALEAQMAPVRQRIHVARRELERIDLAMRSASRAHMITAAVQEAGFETSDPPMVVHSLNSGVSLPDVFELEAVSPGGAGLYVHRPARKSRGKTHAILRAHVPQPVLDVLAEMREAQERVSAANKVGEFGSDERREAAKAARAEVREAGQKLARLVGALPNRMSELDDCGLMLWEARGVGNFGAGSGALKPLAPPDGGRWRWLKVREQAELEQA